MALSYYSGTFEPADLALLQRVFDRAKTLRGFTEKDSEKAEVLAAEIVLLFNQGVKDEAALLRSLGKCGNRVPMIVTIRRVGDDLFSVDWATNGDAVSVRVAVPRSEGSRIYSDAEREDMACKKAQNFALDFVEALVGEKCISIPSHLIVRRACRCATLPEATVP